MAYIGVDLHKRQFTVCYRRSKEDQQIVEFPTTPAGIEQFKQTLTCFDEVAVEAIGMARYFILSVKDSVRRVFLVNASMNALVYQSHKKTDANDARALAFGLERGILPESRLKSEAAYQLRALLTARATLLQTRTRIINYLHSLLTRNCMDLDRDRIKTKLHRDAANVAALGFGDLLAWQSLSRQLDELEPELRRLTKAIHGTISQMRSYSVLKSIPGFGPVTIGYLMSTIDRVEDFSSPKELCAYLGIVPRTRTSDGHPVPSTGKFGRSKAGAITRRGDRKTRGELTMSVNRVLNANASLRAFYERIKGRKGYKKARTAAARKLMVLVYYALVADKPFSDFSAVDVTRPQLIS